MDQEKAYRSDDDDLLTLKEALELVRHKKSWLYKKIDEGLFPPGFKIGRRRFWRRGEVKDALRLLLVPASPPIATSDTQNKPPPGKTPSK
jgi:predicted DNA-binding transcriptional regulator AlpA